ncbi:MAG: hypothetical protein ACOC0D_04460, partial [Spirochaeta sp.]
ELLSRIPNGRGEGQLRYEIQPGSADMSGPNSLFFSGNIPVVADTLNARFVELDSQFNWNRSLSTGRNAPHGYFEETHEGNWVSFSMMSLSGFSSSLEPLYVVVGSQDDPLLTTSFRDALYHNGYLFILNGNVQLVSIESPEYEREVDAGKIRNTDQTRALFAANSDWDSQGLSIDDRDRLFLNGELMTRDFDTFADYWYEVHDGDMEKLTKFGRRLGGDRYIGKDDIGYTYWLAAHLYVLVFDETGKLIEWIKFDHQNVSTIPAVSPEGDLYFMGYEPESINIYRITRRW